MILLLIYISGTYLHSSNVKQTWKTTLLHNSWLNELNEEHTATGCINKSSKCLDNLWKIHH